MKLSLTNDELVSLADGQLPVSVIGKAKAKLKHPRPASGLKGWATAYVVLDRVDDDRQRAALSALVRGLGVQGAPALTYAAQLACWEAGLLKDYQSPKKALKQREVEYIQRRVREEMAALNGVFPKARKPAPPRKDGVVIPLRRG
jgi:hypothetical protein